MLQIPGISKDAGDLAFTTNVVLLQSEKYEYFLLWLCLVRLLTRKSLTIPKHCNSIQKMQMLISIAVLLTKRKAFAQNSQAKVSAEQMLKALGAK
jgi:hypothetical protein